MMMHQPESPARIKTTQLPPAMMYTLWVHIGFEMVLQKSVPIPPAISESLEKICHAVRCVDDDSTTHMCVCMWEENFIIKHVCNIMHSEGTRCGSVMIPMRWCCRTCLTAAAVAATALHVQF